MDDIHSFLPLADFSKTPELEPMAHSVERLATRVKQLEEKFAALEASIKSSK